MLICGVWVASQITAVWAVKKDDEQYKKGYRTQVCTVDGKCGYTTTSPGAVAQQIEDALRPRDNRFSRNTVKDWLSSGKTYVPAHVKRAIRSLVE